MADEPNDRLKKLESALDPAVTKFMPKRITDPYEPPPREPPPAPPPLSQLVQMLRAHGKGILDVCDQVEQHVDGGEEEMKAALDHLIKTVARMK